MAEKPGTLLKDLDQIKPSVIEALRPLWITTVEELVTTAYEDKGREGLTGLLDMTSAEIETMAQDLLPLVPPDIRQQIGVTPRARGLGAWDEFDPDRPRSLLPELPVPDELPERVSLVDRMPAVRNQGMRGTCVAHACAAVREFLTEDTQVDLSEQFLYWAARQKLITPVLKNRPGALLVYGMRALQEYGVCPEADWPYNPNPVPGDEEQGVPPPAIQEKAKTFRIQKYVFLWPRGVHQLKAHLAGGYIVAITVPTFNYWSTLMIGHTGAIRLPMASEGTGNPIVWLESTHALCLAGYQDDESVPGGGYFIVRNSWGTDWATQCPDDAGYGWMPYEYLRRFGLTAFTAV
ncbi:MAG: C1 family peptidase [Anaerolineae bacterium]